MAIDLFHNFVRKRIEKIRLSGSTNFIRDFISFRLKFVALDVLRQMFVEEKGNP